MQHPGIVQIVEIGEQDGQPYLIFELIEGKTLAEFANRERQPPRVAAELVQAMSGAMHYAHQLGIVHRDLKPANVLLADQIRQCGSTVVARRGIVDDATSGKNDDSSIRPPAPSPSSSGPSGSSRRLLSSISSGLSVDRTTNLGLVPKITDFGLAKDSDAESEYTCTGTALGTDPSTWAGMNDIEA